MLDEIVKQDLSQKKDAKDEMIEYDRQLTENERQLYEKLIESKDLQIKLVQDISMLKLEGRKGRKGRKEGFI
jgi:phage-related minor tail protein